MAQQRDRGENERENAGGDLQVALKTWIRIDGDFAQPVGGQKNQGEASGVGQYPVELAALPKCGELIHGGGPVTLRGPVFPYNY